MIIYLSQWDLPGRNSGGSITLRSRQEYRKYEKEGFPTPTGKVELYSTIMEKWGYDPLPGYRETPESPVSKPEMVKEYPYILITGARSPVFYHL